MVPMPHPDPGKKQTTDIGQIIGDSTSEGEVLATPDPTNAANFISGNVIKDSENITVGRSPEEIRRSFYEEMSKSSELLESTGSYSPSVATFPEIEKVLDIILQEKKLPNSQKNRNGALINTIALLHSGATSPQFDLSRSFNIWGLELTNRTLQTSIKKVPGLTARKLARGLRTELMDYAARTCKPGNLSKRYKIAYPLAPISELIWVSDYNTFSDMQGMPERVKVCLSQNLSERFVK
jgi:hypothetical protein